ncbi:reverse transcriptase domain, reverse transcriptase zinc-binding domain protein [Tanacetum coccineum]
MRVRLSDTFRYHNHYEELDIINVCFADDLFIFARGDVELARAIMDSLDELNIIMPFSEGELPVKYLGAPLISSRLLNKDCKVLVEKAQNQIGDWKNKSLSFTGEYRRGKAKVAWDDICLPKHEGGLSLRSLETAWTTGYVVSYYMVFALHSEACFLSLVSYEKTQDKLRSWDVDASTDLSQLRCSLCGSHQDSHNHLFFECTFSSQVWNSIRNPAGMEHVPLILEDIVMWFNPMANNR